MKWSERARTRFGGSGGFRDLGIYNDLRRRGRVLSQVDVMLAALTRQMQLTLVTADQDFAALPDVKTENWITGGSRGL